MFLTPNLKLNTNSNINRMPSGVSKGQVAFKSITNRLNQDTCTFTGIPEGTPGGALSLSPVEMDAAKVFQDVIRNGTLTGKIENIFMQLADGDGALLDKCATAINNIKKEVVTNRSCVHTKDEKGLPVLKIKSGTYEPTFHNRLNVYSKNEKTFAEFLNEKVGNPNALKVTITGWSNPPYDFLKQHPIHKKILATKITDKEKLDYSESIYVDLVKDYLNDVYDNLKKELSGKGFKNDDLVFFYGVTPKGVDRAVQEFAKDKGIKCIGITCYDWLTCLDPKETDVADGYPFYIAETQEEFGRLMAEYSDKILVLGGRTIAANITKTGERLFGAPDEHRLIPVDVMQSKANIIIPGLCFDPVEMKSGVLNSARALLGNDDTDPSKWGTVKSRPDTNFDVNVVVDSFVKDLNNLFALRKAQNKAS